ncbi:hypothetical protein [Actinoplanes teichomyceticus]|uniref:Nucleic acid binding protein n=1 Tax=Actinoplanes teichomyceticus TaxID=1867 RepID=A0A561WI09_ACTTI|nr:hypothetical protein [Actinoplanes teichomyceticus]TWG23496.1 hypothetical protein FHX34_10242 [Actinoplanes teichomyceticus]GIF16119.1 hypothetical protein Ate01nite_61510 [Actinoplanes teichomyceticus]
MIRRSVVPAALLLLLAAGCASRPDDTGPATPGAAPSAAVTGTTPSAVPEATRTTGKPAAGSTTVTGTVASGVEPGCLILRAGKTTHLLIFRDEALRASAAVGSRVRVSGTPRPGLMTTCQQGEPFEVSSVTPG